MLIYTLYYALCRHYLGMLLMSKIPKKEILIPQKIQKQQNLKTEVLQLCWKQFPILRLLGGTLPHPIQRLLINIDRYLSSCYILQSTISLRRFGNGKSYFLYSTEILQCIVVNVMQHISTLGRAFIAFIALSLWRFVFSSNSFALFLEEMNNICNTTNVKTAH